MRPKLLTGGNPAVMIVTMGMVLGLTTSEDASCQQRGGCGEDNEHGAGCINY